MMNSFETLIGRKLIDAEPESLIYSINNAPFVLLSHDIQSDPIFNYANNAGLTLFEYTWQEFIGIPSRLSAEALNREERQKLLAMVNEHKYIDQYSGVRISKTGKRFLIKNAIVWNVYDNAGAYYGQAAMFNEWTYLQKH